MCWVQWDGNRVHFPAWSSEMIPADTEMLLSNPPPHAPSHLQHHQTSWSKKVSFNTPK